MPADMATTRQSYVERSSVGPSALWAGSRSVRPGPVVIMSGFGAGRTGRGCGVRLVAGVAGAVRPRGGLWRFGGPAGRAILGGGRSGPLRGSIESRWQGVNRNG